MYKIRKRDRPLFLSVNFPSIPFFLPVDQKDDRMGCNLMLLIFREIKTFLFVIVVVAVLLCVLWNIRKSTNTMARESAMALTHIHTTRSNDTNRSSITIQHQR